MTPHHFKDKLIGHSTLDDNGTLIFFGNRWATRQLLIDAFPDLSFAFLKQVHGNVVCPRDSAESLPEADGHYTCNNNLALVIQTADCNPIFFRSGSEIFALHAGWRGVASEILLESLKMASTPPQKIFVGPSIKSESFEVDLDVANEILKTLSVDQRQLVQLANSVKSKTNIDLYRVLCFHAQNFSPTPTFIHLDIDTKTNESYFSYRRQAEEKGRNLSFIAIKANSDKINP